MCVLLWLCVLSWSAKLYLTPSNIVLLTAVALIGVCVFILVIIGILHWQEKVRTRARTRMHARTHTHTHTHTHKQTNAALSSPNLLLQCV